MIHTNKHKNMESKLKKDKWILEEIRITFKDYGEHKGKYAGRISFKNGESERFTFNIRPDLTQSYIDLMADDIVICASELGDRLIDSLGLNER